MMDGSYHDWVFATLARMSPWLALAQTLTMFVMIYDTSKRWRETLPSVRVTRTLFVLILFFLTLERYSSSRLTFVSLEDEALGVWAPLTLIGRFGSGLLIWIFVSVAIGWYIRRKGP